MRATAAWPSPSRSRSGRTTAVPLARSSSPTITATAAPAAVGRLHLGLHRAAVVGAVGADAGPAQLAR